MISFRASIFSSPWTYLGTWRANPENILTADFGAKGLGRIFLPPRRIDNNWWHPGLVGRLESSGILVGYEPSRARSFGASVHAGCACAAEGRQDSEHLQLHPSGHAELRYRARVDLRHIRNRPGHGHKPAARLSVADVVKRGVGEHYGERHHDARDSLLCLRHPDFRSSTLIDADRNRTNYGDREREEQRAGRDYGGPKRLWHILS